MTTTPSGKIKIQGIAAPLPIASCDTDQIMPKQFLKIINKEGLSRGMLYDMRFDENGTAKEDFILNQVPWNKAKILVTAPNFGCGSSREHAVWGLMQWGIEAIIGHSFGEIFFSNAFNNGLLLAKVSEEEAHGLLEEVKNSSTSHLAIDISTTSIHTSSGKTIPFVIASRHKEMIMNGYDLIAMTLCKEQEILAYEQRVFSHT